MAKVSPSILSADFCALRAACEGVLAAGADMLHYDVMDGHFVPNISFGIPVLKSLHAGLPHAFYDVHLMISHPLQYVPAFAAAGANLLTFHLESADEPAAVLDAIAAAGCQAGLALRPATPVSAVLPYLERLDLVLVMSVEPGFGGQAFQPAALDKLRQLRAAARRCKTPPLLEVDGGVDEATGAACVAAGADLLVAGSAIFAAPDPARVVRALKAL